MRALVAAALALCATDSLAFAATASTPSRGWHEGFNCRTWWHDEYASTSAYDSLRQLAATGAVAAALIPTWYQRSADATRIEPGAAVPPADRLHGARLSERQSRLVTPVGLSGGVFSGEAQRRAFRAAFRALAPRRWFDGLYIWDWSADPRAGSGDTGHTPQGKPAEAAIRAWFSGERRGEALLRRRGGPGLGEAARGSEPALPFPAAP